MIVQQKTPAGGVLFVFYSYDFSDATMSMSFSLRITISRIMNTNTIVMIALYRYGLKLNSRFICMLSGLNTWLTVPRSSHPTPKPTMIPMNDSSMVSR